LAEKEGRRKTYKITPDGEQALRQEYQSLAEMIKDGALLKGGDNDE